MKFGTQTNKFSIADCRLPIAWVRSGKALERSNSKTLRKCGQAWTIRRGNESAFTLAEVLAALLFLAIVIPAAVEAFHISSLAGEVAARKGAAARVAERILNESLVTTNWNHGTQNGTATEGALDFQWTLSSETWPQGAMQLVTAEVKFMAKGHDYSVKLSTLASSQTVNTGLGSKQ